MRKIFTFILATTLFASCKEAKKEEVSTPKDTVVVTPEKELTILDSVANAHGFNNWKNIAQIQFTFNVDRGEDHFDRTWNWRTKSNDVLAMSATDTIAYNRASMDSIAKKTNAGFINDKYWLLAPFNLVWDKDNITFTTIKSEEAPISKKPMRKLTIVYGNAGGYTPGDAYDFYFEDDYLIKEWVYRKENAVEPSMSTTWENYTEQNGLKIALDHKNAEGNFKLYFTDVKSINK